MRRSLRLCKETLSELTAVELGGIVGGVESEGPICFRDPLPGYSDNGHSCSECYITREPITLYRCSL